MNVIGRLKQGVSKEQAQAEMTAISARLEQQYPDKNLHRGTIGGADSGSVGRQHSSGFADSVRARLAACY